FIPEVASLLRSSTFNEEDYIYQHDHIKMYIKSTQYNVWRIITHGDLVIIKLDPSIIRVTTLQRYYKMFMIKEGEPLMKSLDFSKPFPVVFNFLGISSPKLRTVSRFWISIAIQEVHDMKTLTLDELLRALRVHEIHMFKRNKIKDNKQKTRFEMVILLGSHPLALKIEE
ncbi:hypothetical protein CR513_22991, partial [Mucuna pruriens]